MLAFETGIHDTIGIDLVNFFFFFFMIFGLIGFRVLSVVLCFRLR